MLSTSDLARAADSAPAGQALDHGTGTGIGSMHDGSRARQDAPSVHEDLLAHRRPDPRRPIVGKDPVLADQVSASSAKAKRSRT
ncbi:MAG: hypothetical protein F4Y40_02180 [Acidimicrobiia bacterium]|nr:hypothetical protein [Acidimicrobiia bacterium]